MYGDIYFIFLEWPWEKWTPDAKFFFLLLYVPSTSLPAQNNMDPYWYPKERFPSCLKESNNFPGL
jgi:hypothetical protein